ncbi:MAG TPA: TetR/AcrR family transcriptional regulator [Acidimicrobiia bacterium]|nr:TetR/AcrR family transcriptional regulator [Acidimicrobiia bacterium]
MATADQRDRILDAAQTIVESGDPLTMRKLAADVGLAPTAIYWHVGNRSELVDALIDRMIAALGSPRPRGSTPAARIASIARWLRRRVLEQPHLVTLAHEHGRSGALYFPAQAALAREVLVAGLAGEDAANAVRTVLFHIGGSILMERSEFVGARPMTEPHWSGDDAAGVEPAVAAALAAPVDFDAQFETSLGVLLRAILPRA